jgi:1-phosphofructokinase/tagatose 6-phosphate kinase
LIITVTLNAAIDRTLTVPNFRGGQRHRASQGLSLAGGKGIIVARTLKLLGVPVVATGLAGGRTGERIIEELAREAILNDFARIDDESRTSTAVVDPTSGTHTEIYEWGPQVRPEELATLTEKLVYLSRGAELVVISGSLPRAVDDGFYGELIRELSRRGIRVALDAEGEPLLQAIEAEPALVSTTQAAAEAIVGQEFHDEQDFLLGIETIAELGARSVLIAYDLGLFALIREDRRERRFHVIPPEVEVVSAVGAGDVALGAFVAARIVDDKPVEEALRLAAAACWASKLELGAGRFEPREVARLAPLVDVQELAAPEQG